MSSRTNTRPTLEHGVLCAFSLYKRAAAEAEKEEEEEEEEQEKGKEEEEEEEDLQRRSSA